MGRNGCCGTEKERITMAMSYYLKWNLLTDKFADRSFQLEKLDAKQFMSAWRYHCPLIDCQVFGVTHKKFWQRISPKSLSGPGTKKKLTWSKLKSTSPGMTRPLQALADVYGYKS